MTSLVDELRSIVGPDACLARPEELFVYECDGLTLEPVLPSAVPSFFTQQARSAHRLVVVRRRFRSCFRLSR